MASLNDRLINTDDNDWEDRAGIGRYRNSSWQNFVFQEYRYRIAQFWTKENVRILINFEPNAEIVVVGWGFLIGVRLTRTGTGVFAFANLG